MRCSPAKPPEFKSRRVPERIFDKMLFVLVPARGFRLQHESCDLACGVHAVGPAIQIERATALIPVLRSHQTFRTALSRLPDTTVADLGAAGMFDLLVSDMYGGLQCCH